MSEKNSSYHRYQRQIILPGMGEEGQSKLHQQSVLVVGAGGLGCPALQYLVAAGIGKIGIVDDDLITIDNLHRQVLYTTEDVGLPKVEAAASRLRKMNPGAEVMAYRCRLDNQNAIEIISDYNVVLDATDNFATRYLINDACVLLQKPLVYGAISQFEGQVAVFNVGEGSVNYRDLFPQPPKAGSILDCEEAGVIGVLPGIVGLLQATEVIKLTTGLGNVLHNQLLAYNALTNETYVFALTAKEGTAALLPRSIEALKELDYEWICGNSSTVVEIDINSFNELKQDPATAIIDVREYGEQPVVNDFRNEQIPLSSFAEKMDAIKQDTVILFCQSGKRSREAAGILSHHKGATKKIYSLEGGISNWIRNGSTEA